MMSQAQLPNTQPSNNKAWIAPLVLALVWLAGCYAVRFLLMEDPRWLDICDGRDGGTLCAVRASLGLIIHWRILPYLALLLAVPAFFVKGRGGARLAWWSLLFGLPALALYTVTPAVFALLLAALRIVRNERHNAPASASDTSAQPIA